MAQTSVSEFVGRLLCDRRLLFAAWCLIAIECILATWLFKPWAIGDSFHYLELARNLRQGHYGTVTQAGFEADPTRPPGYPIILWFLQYVVQLPPVGVVAIQLLAYTGSIYLIQRYLQKIGINPTVFVVLVAGYPFPLLYSTFLLTESWVILATVVAALLMTRRTSAGYALAGASAALAGLIRADLILLPLLFFVVILLDAAKPVGLGARLGKAILPVVAASLVVLPYAVWNYQHFGRFTPLPRAGAVGTSLLLTTFQRNLTPEDIAALEERKYTAHARQLGVPQTFQQIDREVGAPPDIGGFDPYNFPTAQLRIAAPQAYLRIALQRISANPGFYANHVVHNLWELWVTKKYAPKLASAPKIGGLVIFCLALVNWSVFILGMTGMVVAVAQPKDWLVPWILVPITWYPAGIHIWLHTEARYTAATRPLLVMFAAAFLAWLGSRYVSQRESLEKSPVVPG